jgi:hypothetical protein
VEHLVTAPSALPILLVLAAASSVSAQAPAPAPQAAPAPAPPPAQAPAPAVPAPAPAQPPADPARLEFPADTVTGLVLVAIKADRTADYDAVLARLREVLASTTDEARRRQAQGWQVLRAQEKDAKGNVIYVHVIASPVPGVDYRPSFVLDALVEALAPELLAKYRDAFAAAPTRLSLGPVAAPTTAPPKPPPR